MKSLVLGLCAAVTVVAGTAPVAAKDGAGYDEKRWALIIGVSHYDDLGGVLSDLHGPHNDARRISQALINQGRFNPQHVIVVADETPLLPTRDNILEQLDTVTENVQDGLLVFFFAGHGLEAGGEAYLLPNNVRGVDQPASSRFQSSAVRVSEVRKHIEESKVGRVVLMIDACRDNPRDPSPRGRGVSSARNGTAFRQAFSWNNSVMMFSTQTGHEAFETGSDPSVGYFADALARALDGLAPRAINSAGQVTVGSLMDYLPEAVDNRVRKELKRGQRPQIIADTGGSIALTFPGLGKAPPLCEDGSDPPCGPGEPPKPRVRLRLRLADAALSNAGLVVTRNKFSLDRLALTAPVVVEPGKQYVEVKLPGYRPWSRDVTVESGDVDIEVPLEPNRKPMYLALGIGGGLGLISIATGLAYGLRASHLSDQVSDACEKGCRFERGSDLYNKDQDGRRAHTLQNVFLVSGGVLAAGGAAAAAYFYLKRPPLAPDRRSGLDVAISTDGAGIAWRHDW